MADVQVRGDPAGEVRRLDVSPRPTIIHVNQNVIRSNRKHGLEDPPITIRQGGKVVRASLVELRDRRGGLVAVIKYSPQDPLSCGARVWIELVEAVAKVV